jgi:peptidyl-prolyl cis-trans isomerase A (cyclophilin A)
MIRRSLLALCLTAPKSPTEGEGFMRGQMLDPRIRIVTARRASVP